MSDPANIGRSAGKEIQPGGYSGRFDRPDGIDRAISLFIGRHVLRRVGQGGSWDGLSYRSSLAREGRRENVSACRRINSPLQFLASFSVFRGPLS
jgi:hypothetical protein